ncbi:MAG: dihydroorotate dehydrogenase family protein [Thermoleophilia bacterium]|nr:dihydroorotate dehydrogenase family protein [Thermoleophilia bacterium]
MVGSAQVHLGGLSLDVGLVNGSGVVDVTNPTEGWNLPDEVVAKLGAFVTKTVTTEPRRGHPAPVVAPWGSDGSLVNAVGLANPGLDAVIEHWSGLQQRLGIPIIFSVEGHVDRAAELVGRLAAETCAAAFELNLSCPNVGGGLIAADPVATGAVVAAARAATQLPIIVKLSPAGGRSGEVARSAEAAGADALCCGNTMPVHAFAPDGRPLLGNGFGAGLSGADLHPVALRLVADVAAATELPVIGLGGVRDDASLHRMLDAGAQLVGVGTAAWNDHDVVARLRAALVAIHETGRR